VHEAHRSHAYQHAALKWGSHLPVTLAVAAINLCWLLPIAIVVLLGWIDPLVGVVVAYAPLAAAVLWLEGGTPSGA
jgi:Fuc2NAc and GlcNAc transferase